MKIRGKRIIFLVLTMLIILAVFVVRLMRYQLVDGDSYRQQAEKSTLSTATVTASRGEILDRYGRILATNRVGYSVTLNWAFLPSITKETAKLNRIILQLTTIIKGDGEQWVDNLPISAAKPYAFLSGSEAGVKSMQKLLKISADLTADQVMQKLCDRYKIDKTLSDADKRTIAGARYEMEIRSFSIRNNTLLFASDVGMTTVTKVSENSLDLPGVEIAQNPIRIYTDGTIAPHIMGMVGPIFPENYASLSKKGYSMNDIVGHGGLEESEEQYLRGTDGTESIEVSHSGKVTNETTKVVAKPGDTVVSTIDSRLQVILQNSLAKNIQKIASDAKGDITKGANANSGASVVIDIKTGEVLAMASYPTYDLNTYKANYSALLKQDGKPMLNRTVQGQYRPGSTFKPVVATGGLMYNAITPQTTFDCVGQLALSGSIFRCDSVHGIRNVIGALKVSCNFFFYNVGLKLGMANMDKIATILGLGQPTGIEIGESKGVLSSPAERAEKNEHWYPGDVVQSAIGQSDNQFTPVQLASYVATLMNSGTRYQLHLVKQVNSYDNQSVVLKNDPKVLSKTVIPASVLSVVKQGMNQVTENGGTASNAFGSDYAIKVGGKTGTAQEPGGYYNGVFICFAPVDDPQIAIVAVVEHGYHGNQIANVAKDICDAYFLTKNNVQAPIADNTLLP
jgi:penicillin-binding protein 2